MSRVIYFVERQSDGLVMASFAGMYVYALFPAVKQRCDHMVTPLNENSK